jgi:hypothetical protein
VSSPTRDVEVRRALHELREPIGAFALNIELLGNLITDRDDLRVAAESYLKAIRAELERARVAFEEMDFLLENGHARLPGAKR